MSTKNVPIQFRQGDVFLEEVIDVPATAVCVSPDPKRGHVLADGEVTGHSHRVPRRHAGNAAAYRTEADAMYLRVTAPVPLRHEEHKTACALCPEAAPGEEFPIATHRLVDRYGADAYRCTAHATLEQIPIALLAEPGATDLPPGMYERTIHLEYVPGALARRVED